MYVRNEKQNTLVMVHRMGLHNMRASEWKARVHTKWACVCSVLCTRDLRFYQPFKNWTMKTAQTVHSSYRAEMQEHCCCFASKWRNAMVEFDEFSPKWNAPLSAKPKYTRQEQGGKVGSLQWNWIMHASSNENYSFIVENLRCKCDCIGLSWAEKYRN